MFSAIRIKNTGITLILLLGLVSGRGISSKSHKYLHNIYTQFADKKYIMLQLILCDMRVYKIRSHYKIYHN